MVLLLLVLVALVLALFAYQNPGLVQLTFGVWSWHVPTWYPVVAVALIMLLIAMIWVLRSRRKLRNDDRSLTSVRQDQVIANHAALLADHESAITSLHRETERIAEELERRRDLLA